MNKWKRFALVGGLVLAVLFLLPFLLPTSAYLSQIEQIASTKLGAPVKIESLRIALLPSPRLNIGGLQIGQNHELSVERVIVLPALTSLFSDIKVISSIRLEKPVIKKTAMNILTAYSQQQAPSSTATAVTIQRIEVERARLEGLDMKLPEFNADVALSPENKPESVLVQSLDGKLNMKLLPAANERQSITVTAEQWKVLVGPPLLIDKLAMQMLLYTDRLEVSQFDVALYQGRLTGDAILNWDKDWRLAGKVKVDKLAVREPVSLMAKSTRVSGNLFGSGSFSAKAKQPAQLADALNADFRFKVENGVLYGLDLTKAASLLLRQGQKGGETQFDELSGVLNASGKLYQFSNLKATSGLMTAGGNVKIKPDKALDGAIGVEVKNSATLATIPLQVSGTVSEPVVLPTKAAMAGAVAGTAVLGPLGTGLGIKAGSALDKLFGGDKK